MQKSLDFDTESKEQSFDNRNDVCIWMIKNQFGRRNLVPFVRVELACKLKEFFKKKGKENQASNFESFGELVKKETPIYQNSDKPVSMNNQVVKKFNGTVLKNSMALEHKNQLINLKTTMSVQKKP